MLIRNTRGARDPLALALSAFNALKKKQQLYSEIKIPAGRLKLQPQQHPQHQQLITFTHKNPKEYNLRDLKQLVLLDSLSDGVKIKLFTNNKELKTTDTVPELRRILNNGLYYGVYYNSRQQCRSTLNEIGSFTEDPEYEHKLQLRTQPCQTILVEMERDGKVTYSEGSLNAPMQSVMIEVNGKKHKMLTMSLAALVNIRAIGLPLSHAWYRQLKDVVLPHPFQPDEKLTFLTVPMVEGNHLEALIPSHILEHGKYFNEKISPVRPRHFSYKGKLCTVAKLSQIVAQSFGVGEPLIPTCPFILTKTVNISNGKPLTTITGAMTTILDERAFPTLETVGAAPFTLRNLDDKFPLESISMGAVLAMLSFNKQSERFLKVDITGDSLRCAVLQHEYLCRKDLLEIGQVLELVTSSLEYFHGEGLINAKFRWVNKLSNLAKTCEDGERELLRQFFSTIHGHRAKDERLGLGDFALALNEYILYLESAEHPMTSERRSQVRELVSNAVYRFLNDQMSYNWPELSLHYTNKFGFITKSPAASDIKGQKNDWSVKVCFKNEHVVRDESREKLTQLVGALYSISTLPTAFAQSFEVTLCDVTTQNQQLLQRVVSKLGGRSLQLVSEHGLLAVDYCQAVYDDQGIKVIPFRSVVDLSVPSAERELWVHWFKENGIDSACDDLVRHLEAIWKPLVTDVKHCRNRETVDELKRFMARQFDSVPQGFWEAVESHRLVSPAPEPAVAAAADKTSEDESQVLEVF